MFDREPDDHLERVSVDLNGVEVLEPDLSAAEHPEFVAVQFALHEIKEAIITPTVHIGGPEASRAHGELDVSD